VKSSLRSHDRVGGRTIVCPCVAFAKIICLHTVCNAAAELPVYLVKIIGQEDHATDDASSRSGFHNVLHAAEEEIEISAHCGSIKSVLEGQLSPGGSKINDRILSDCPVGRQSLGGSKVNIIEI